MSDTFGGNPEARTVDECREGEKDRAAVFVGKGRKTGFFVNHSQETREN